jgi:hypothetical protein
MRNKLRAKAAKLLEVVGNDPQVVAVVDAFLAVDEMIARGYILREGGGAATKPRPMPPEWKDSGEPPERP